MIIKKIINRNLPEVFEITPVVHEDDRGFFLETFSRDRYKDIGINDNFVQDNYSRSYKNVLRGLHYQNNNPQGKLVRCVKGTIFDVAVDIRRHSTSFGQIAYTILDEFNKKQLWIPPGFAHGFCVLSEVADFEYKCTEFYDPSSEGVLLWNDSELDIPWPITNPIISKKDAIGMRLKDI